MSRNVHFVSLLTLSLFTLGWNTPSHADVVAKGANGFQIRIERSMEASPEQVYRALTQVSQWWSAEHTYSLDADNLYLEPKAHGWFGERLPDGGVVCHMEVVFVQPGKMIRLTGGLGPLQQFGVQGAMTWSILETDEGTKLTMLYNVSGFMPDGMQPFAEPVNGVLSQQADGLKEFVESELEAD